MSEDRHLLPSFKYHPDPVATGAIVKSEKRCKVCGEVRGFIYPRNPYGRRSDLEESICPWCIHDGRAHERFDVLFADPYGLTSEGLDQSIIDEVITKTPGYETWQGEVWLAHCNDACAFLGDASKEHLRNFASEGARFVPADDWNQEAINQLLEYYEPKGSPSIYRFQCIHCGQVLYAIDCD